ncbi:hypothetical protein BJ085DRAFT_38917 [Dimargaris cristalligena]|uniref:Uncharacterized protein n=1 Tax=Dimargaris cristalligena TaxID=215637 RepID=A0A4P9ZL85_9FUNG|nr:hypothetical protein BJ085DRAFT_38917 [Dimargaris cristalligena]|eukprot:RKP33342.1 hypothetical protein BJ085DRAFT_38917 [Dimargaris cristalligena]
MYTHRDSWADIRRYLLDSEDTKEYSTGTQRSRALRKLVQKKPKSKNLVSFLLQFAATANQTPMVSDEEKIDLLSSMVPSRYIRVVYDLSPEPHPSFKELHESILRMACNHAQHQGASKRSYASSSSESDSNSDSSSSDSDTEDEEDSGHDHHSQCQSQCVKVWKAHVQQVTTVTPNAVDSLREEMKQLLRGCPV